MAALSKNEKKKILQPAGRSKLYRSLPDTPGVYVMKGVKGRLLYVGKAGNLRRRVSSYFLRPHLHQGFGGQAHDSRLERLVSLIQKIDIQKTDTALEALILEAQYIKKFEPPFNIREKDDKSFLYVAVTREDFPRILLVRGKEVSDHDSHRYRKIFGPFTSSSSLRSALRLIRKIFPYSIHPREGTKKTSRPCFDYEIGLCPGTCIGAISKADYQKTIRNIILFFEGKKKKILQSLKQEMKRASRGLEFEKAEKLRRQIFALQHIQDISLIKNEGEESSMSALTPRFRIEGYDISNISGTSSVGSMVVFEDGQPNKSEYRKFRIKTVKGSNDVAMIEEVLTRRLKNSWQLPNLLLIDGGAGQVAVAEKVVRRFNLQIPVVGLAKGPERKRNDLVGQLPAGVQIETLIQVRDEAHRFAIQYHKKVRSREFLQ